MAGCFFATPALTSRRSISSCSWPRSLIVGIMIVFAIVNRYVFMPAIPNGGPVSTSCAWARSRRSC